VRDYALFSPAFWIDKPGKLLRGDPVAQTLGAYLKTCSSSTMLGLFYLPLPMVSHETGLSAEQVDAGLAKLESTGVGFYDREAELVWLPFEAAAQIAPALDPKDKRCAGVARQLERFGRHPFAEAFRERYREAFHLSAAAPPSKGHPSAGPGSEGASKGHPSPSEGPSKGLRSQDQDQNQEQNQTHTSGGRGHAHEGQPDHGAPPGQEAAAKPPPPRLPPRVPPREDLGPEARQLLVALEAARHLGAVATAVFAEQLASRAVGAMRPLDQVVQAIDAADRDAGAAASTGSPLAPAELARMVARYADRSRSPPPTRGAPPPKQTAPATGRAWKPATPVGTS
jgi:hypothetical protein